MTVSRTAGPAFSNHQAHHGAPDSLVNLLSLVADFIGAGAPATSPNWKP